MAFHSDRANFFKLGPRVDKSETDNLACSCVQPICIFSPLSNTDYEKYTEKKCERLLIIYHFSLDLSSDLIMNLRMTHTVIYAGKWPQFLAWIVGSFMISALFQFADISLHECWSVFKIPMLQSWITCGDDIHFLTTTCPLRHCFCLVFAQDISWDVAVLDRESSGFVWMWHKSVWISLRMLDWCLFYQLRSACAFINPP